MIYHRFAPFLATVGPSGELQSSFLIPGTGLEGTLHRMNEEAYCAAGFGRVTRAPMMHRTVSAANRATCFQCEAVAGAEARG